MIRFFVRRPSVVFIFLMTVVVTGYVSLRTMTIELWPPVEINEVNIATFYPGASAEEIEDLITIPIEDELDDVDDVDYIASSSANNASRIRVVFKPGVSEAAMDDKTRDVQQRVNRVQDLPSDASTPLVEKITTSNIPAAILSFAGPYTELQIKQIADDFADAIDDFPGVKKAWISGAREREIQVICDPERLEAYGLSTVEVINALRSRHVDVPAGSIFVDNKEYILRVLGKPRNLDELGRIVVRQSPLGNVFLSDVATIQDAFKDPSILAHFNGHRAVLCMFAKERAASTVATIDRVKAEAEAFSRTWPDLEIATVYDTSIDVRKRMSELVSNGIQGFVLVVLILWFQIGWRRALITAFGIPVSFLGTFIVMNALGISLNFMTTYGLFIVLGILVDDAIVVVENIARLGERGMSPKRAAIEGARQVALPVVIAVTTTVIAFSAMLLMSGVIGRFMGYLPKVVIIVLAFSLIESLLLLPTHVAEFVPADRLEAHQRTIGYRFLVAAQGWLERGLRPLLRRPYLWFFFPPTALMVAVYIAGTHVPVEMFPAEEPLEVYVTFDLAPGSSLDATEAVAKSIQDRILAMGIEEIRDVYAPIGYRMNDETGANRTNIGQVICVLVDRSERKRTGFEVEELLRQEFVGNTPGVQMIRAEHPEGGPPKGKAIYVRVLGDDFAILERIASDIKTFVAGYDGVINIDDDRKDGNPELRVQVDEEKCGKAGVDFGLVATTVRTMFIGAKAAERRIDDETVDISVLGPPSRRQMLSTLEQITVPSAAGHPVRLVDLVNIEEGRGPVAVQRRDGKHMIGVFADIRYEGKTPVANASEINAALREKFFAAVSADYPGYRLEFGGEQEEQAESFSSLFIAFIAAVLLIYACLVIQFNTLWQPLVVMLTVPTTFVGVSVGLLVFGETFNLSTMIGIVALVGICVNDSLVYIDYINHLRRNEGYDRDDALLEAARTRLRPIILTTMTTVAGLLPMALRIGGGSAYLSPLASSIIYGLTTQLFFTLLFIPVGYRVMEDVAGQFSRVLHRIMPAPDPRDAEI